MKNFSTYILESSKYFKIEENVHEALLNLLGYMLEYYEADNDNETKKFKEFKNTLSKNEIEIYNNLYDTFDDNTYKYTINSRMLSKEEKELLKKFLSYIDSELSYDDIAGDTDVLVLLDVL